MIDKENHEIDAIIHAGQLGGEFIDSIKVYDLRKLTVEQYNTFVECIITAHQDFSLKKNPIQTHELPF